MNPVMIEVKHPRPDWAGDPRPATPGYRERILAVVPDLDPRHVEAYMRGEHSTLDHLTPARFDALALSCAEDVRSDPAFAETVAASQGF